MGTVPMKLERRRGRKEIILPSGEGKEASPSMRSAGSAPSLNSPRQSAWTPPSSAAISNSPLCDPIWCAGSSLATSWTGCRDVDC